MKTTKFIVSYWPIYDSIGDLKKIRKSIEEVWDHEYKETYLGDDAFELYRRAIAVLDSTIYQLEDMIIRKGVDTNEESE